MTPAHTKSRKSPDLSPRMLSTGARMYLHPSNEYIQDMGTPECKARLRTDRASSLTECRSSQEPCPAVFLDRDGTLNVEVNRVCPALERRSGA